MFKNRQSFLLFAAIFAFASCTKKVTKTNKGGTSTSNPPPIDAPTNPGNTTGPVSCSLTNPLSSAWRSNSSETFSFSCVADGKNLSALQCQLNDGPWVGCQSPYQVTNLANGPQKFRLRGTNSAGSQGMSNYIYWNVDTSAPTIQNFSLLSNEFGGARFSFTASDNDSGLRRVECKLDKGFTSWTECSSPQQWPQLQKGQNYVMSLRAIDFANNTSPIQTLNFTTTGTAVSLGSCNITSLVPTYTALRSLNISYACTAPAGESLANYGIQCRVDSNTFANCKNINPFTITNLSDGTHRFEVRLVDSDGEVGTTASAQWTVDTVPPVVDILRGNVRSNAPSFEFEGRDETSGIALYECQLSQGSSVISPWGLCQSPTTYSFALERGQLHHFQVRAGDRAGNKSTVTQFSWVTNPLFGPACNITTVIANGASNQSTQKIDYSCSSPAPILANAYECSVDGGTWRSCPEGSETLRNLSEGPHSFQVRAKDSFDNIGPASPSLNWVVDKTAPRIISLNVVNESPRAQFIFATDDNSAKVYCGIKEASATGATNLSLCSSPMLFSNLALGKEYLIEAYPQDLAGNQGGRHNLRFVSSTTRPIPVCTILSNDITEHGYTKKTSLLFNVNCTQSDIITSLSYGADNSNTPETFTNPQTVSFNGAGQHCLHLRVRDSLGRSAFYQRCFVTDIRGPEVELTGRLFLDGTLAVQDSLQLIFRGFDEYSGSGLGTNAYQCRLLSDLSQAVNSSPPTETIGNCLSPYIVTGMRVGRAPGGRYVFAIKATDRVGNEGQEKAYTWTNGKWGPWSACTNGVRTRSCLGQSTENLASGVLSGLACENSQGGSSSEGCGPQRCANGALNFPQCTQCPSGFVYNASKRACKGQYTMAGFTKSTNNKLYCRTGYSVISMRFDNAFCDTTSFSGNQCKADSRNDKGCHFSCVCEEN